MHNDTELVKASARFSSAVLGYSPIKKLQEGHVDSQLVPDYVHVQFVHSVNPAQ